MISVIMPAYNEEKYIAKAIESLLNQTNQEFELVVVNDGSQDNTASIVDQYVSRESKISFVNSSQKIGKVAAYNQASKLIKGDWVYFMGADDQIPKNAFEIWEKATRGLDCNKKIALRGRMLIYSENKNYEGLVLPKNKQRLNFSGPLTLLSKGMQKFILPIPQDLPNEDNWWSLCIRFFADRKICIDDIIVHYNINEGNSISRNDSFENFTEKYHIRYVARRDFIERFKASLTKKDIEILNYELVCEDFRFNGKSFSILFNSKVPIITRIRLFMLSRPKLYYFKMKNDRIFLGH